MLKETKNHRSRTDPEPTNERTMVMKQQRVAIWLVIASIALVIVFIALLLSLFYEIPGYPWSMIIFGIGIIGLVFTFSGIRLWKATSSQRIPRLIHLIGASFLLIGMIQSSYNIVAPIAQQIQLSAVFSLLNILAVVLMISATLLESFIDKPNFRSWGRAIGLGLLGGLVLLIILITWISLI